MVTGRAMASLIVPGRGKGSSREETKVQSWTWVGDKLSPNTQTLIFLPHLRLLPASPVAIFPIFQGLRAWLREGCPLP